MRMRMRRHAPIRSTHHPRMAEEPSADVDLALWKRLVVGLVDMAVACALLPPAFFLCAEILLLAIPEMAGASSSAMRSACSLFSVAVLALWAVVAAVYYGQPDTIGCRAMRVAWLDFGFPDQRRERTIRGAALALALPFAFFLNCVLVERVLDERLAPVAEGWRWPRRAPHWRRIAAGLADGVLLFGGLAMASSALNPGTKAAWRLLCLIPFAWLAYGACAERWLGGSLGHFLFGLRVVEAQTGDPIGLARAIKRNASKMLGLSIAVADSCDAAVVTRRQMAAMRESAREPSQPDGRIAKA
ncbi:RDD family protein [Methylacidimicrobium sp. B4]|uniref:RDD family protein n=1 Tax=Methylacidimicrobium sp. B4 TaxID=2796139 RepID=UPI001A90C7A5|nr:RDD family protein [Methylacidimicrobium sp. B4]QSR84579.1 RDD family protein [Methylacidimicrobium sp. B4]